MDGRLSMGAGKGLTKAFQEHRGKFSKFALVVFLGPG